MCWSSESSRNAYIVGSISSILLMLLGNNIYKNIGFFFLIVVQMQLIEYFIWIDHSCGNINNFASKMIVPELSMQALAMVLGALIFKTTNLSNSSLIALVLFVSFVEFGTIFLYLNNIKNEKLCSKKIQNKGIVWDLGKYDLIKNNDILSMLWSIVYYSCLFAFPFLWKSNSTKYIFAFIMIFSYLTIRLENQISWQSRWCFPAAIIPSFYVLLMLLGFN